MVPPIPSDQGFSTGGGRELGLLGDIGNVRRLGVAAGAGLLTSSVKKPGTVLKVPPTHQQPPPHRSLYFGASVSVKMRKPTLCPCTAASEYSRRSISGGYGQEGRS